MPEQNLDLTVRRRRDGVTWGPFRIYADPDNTPALLKALEENARAAARRDHTTRWMPEFEAVVKFPDRPGRKPLIVPGVERT